MSNFICPHCGMKNIDLGEKGFKTPREIELEETLEEILEYRLLEIGLSPEIYKELTEEDEDEEDTIVELCQEVLND